MSIWAQIEDKMASAIPVLGETDDPRNAPQVAIYAYFMFSGKPVKEGAAITFLIGKGGLPKEDTDPPTVTTFTLDSVLDSIMPIEGVAFEDGSTKYVAKVTAQQVVNASGELEIANVARVNLAPITSLLISDFTVVAYSSFDLLNKQTRLQACEASFSVASGNGGSYLSVLERYDPSIDQWETLEASKNGRSGAVFENVAGKLYLIGGFNGNFTGANEEYTPLSNSWVTKTSMPSSRGFCQSAVVGGKIYVLGGYSFAASDCALTSCHSYDPATDEWQELSPLPIPVAYGIAEAIGTDIYVLCGGSSFKEEDKSINRINSISFKYNTLTDTWTAIDVTIGPNLIAAGFTQVSTTLQANAIAGSYMLELPPGLRIAPYGAVTLDRAGSPSTLIYEHYSLQTGLMALRTALTVPYSAGTTVNEATMPVAHTRIGGNSYVSGTNIRILNGQCYYTYTGKVADLVRGTTLEFNPSTGVIDVTAIAIPSVPRYKAGAVTIGTDFYLVAGSADKSDWLDELESFDGTSWTSKANLLYARSNPSVASDGVYLYTAGGSGSGHDPGWLRIEATCSPEQIRADGKTTASISITATDASGDTPPDGTKFSVRGIIYVPQKTTQTETLDATSTTGTTTEAKEPQQKQAQQKTSILPVLFAAQEIVMVNGKASTILLPRSEDPITEVENLLSYTKSGEAVPNEQALKNKVNTDLSNKSTTVGSSRDLYSAAIEITCKDPFYFGSSDSDKVFADQTASDLSSSSDGFSFDPSPAQAGLSAQASWFSNITSIPDVQIVKSEVNRTEAESSLDKLKEELPFGASPHYDAMYLGIQDRIDSVYDRKNILISTSDNDENYSQVTPQDVVDEANAIDGIRRFPVFPLSFVVTDPVSLSARKSRTDVADLEKIATDTGGNSFSVIDSSYITYVIDRIKTSAPSSMGSGTVTKTHAVNGKLSSVSYDVSNMIAGNSAVMRIWTSDNNYTWTELAEQIGPNVAFAFGSPIACRYVRYQISLRSKTFNSPVLTKVTLGISVPATQYLFTYPQTISGQVAEIAGVVNHRVRLPSGFDYAGMQAQMGLAHGESIMWERDYEDVTQPAIKERGVTLVVNRSFDTYINGSESTMDVLYTEDFLIYRSKSGPWPQESTTRVFVNDLEALPEQYICFPERGVVVFQRRLGPRDVVSVEMDQPNTFRVGLKIENPTSYLGYLDSFAYMFGTTQDLAGNRPNHPPRAINLFISPSPVLPGGPITANYTFSDIDGDEEDKTKTEIMWFRNGAPVPELKNKRTFSNNDLLARRSDGANTLIVKGQQWFFTVRPNDGKAFGPMMISHTITVANQNPSVTETRLVSGNSDQAKFTTQDSVKLVYTFKDLDNDKISTTLSIISWYVNGALVKSGQDDQITGGEKDSNGNVILKPNVTVRAEITPSDGTSFGDTVTTDAVTVLGSAPSVDDVTVSPAKPFTTSKLKATWTFTSPDGNADQSTIAWYMNGERRTELDNSTEVAASLLAPRQEWYAIVTPFDGNVEGTPAKSNTVVVQF